MDEVVVELADKLGVAVSELLGALGNYLPFYYGGICAACLAGTVLSIIALKVGFDIYKNEDGKSFFSMSEFNLLFSFLMIVAGGIVGSVCGYFFFTSFFNMLAAIFSPEGMATFYIISLLG